ncbi:MAG: YkgJ family cysteine cluster protein [Candidatus Micrarchaeota archaeon]|nr:YkgJ family cysteine cluster protein [Candidatus Micrarchaeota archaeon]
MKRFKCVNCGYCCKDMHNLALFEWERDLIQKINNKVKIIPGHKIRYRNTDIILYWGLQSREPCRNELKKNEKSMASKSGTCPFVVFEYGLSKCSIYENRPLVCRSYPFFHIGVKGQDEMISIDCPEAIIPFKEGEKLSRGEFYSALFSIYKETFIDAVRLELSRVWIADLAEIVLAYLEKNNLDLDRKEIGLLSLAIELGIMTEEEINKELDFIYSDQIIDWLFKKINK